MAEEIEVDLDDVADALTSLSINHDRTDDIVHATRKLAEASKTDLNIRKGLGNPKALGQLVTIIDSNLSDSLETVDVALRCIGNACIDNDLARSNVTRQGFTWAKRCLAGDEATAILSMKVLYNICLDYEVAQQQCFQENVHLDLVRLYARADVAADAPLLIELLFWICGHKQTILPNGADIDASTLASLLTLPESRYVSLEVEDYAMLMESCLTMLRDSAVQEDIVQPDVMLKVWRLLSLNEQLVQQAGNTDDHKLLAPLSTSLIWVMSDTSAIPTFPHHNDILSFWATVFARPILRSGTNTSPALTTAAAQVLGNLLWSSKEPLSFEELVLGDQMHIALFDCIVSSQNLEVMHAAAGLLLQLTRVPGPARELMAEAAQSSQAVEILCGHANPQLKQDGVKLLRVIGQHSPAVQAHFAGLAQEVMADLTKAGAETEDTSMELGPG